MRVGGDWDRAREELKLRALAEHRWAEVQEEEEGEADVEGGEEYHTQENVDYAASDAIIKAQMHELGHGDGDCTSSVLREDAVVEGEPRLPGSCHQSAVQREQHHAESSEAWRTEIIGEAQTAAAGSDSDKEWGLAPITGKKGDKEEDNLAGPQVGLQDDIEHLRPFATRPCHNTTAAATSAAAASVAIYVYYWHCRYDHHS